MTQTSITRSWVASANDHADFPLQNLPLGVFSVEGLGAAQRRGHRRPYLRSASGTRGRPVRRRRESCRRSHPWRPVECVLRAGPRGSRGPARTLAGTAREGSTLHGKIEAQGAKLLPLAADCEMHLPAKINDYTDFYVGIEHAQNVGKLFRPDNPLLPNYKYVPIGYHGRASTIRPSGTDVSPSERPDPAGRSDRADLRPVRAPGLRTGAGHLDRPGQRHGRLHRHR